MAYFNENVSKLGFGLMRPPMNGDEIDIEQLKKMADMYLEAGFNYFDTAYGYVNGKSEEAVKKVLVERYPRDKFYLATKLPAWAGAKNKKEAEQMFYTSLERTGAGYFDFYLLHNMGEGRTKYFDEYGIWDFVQERKKEGLIKHVGFSFHDKAASLEEILTKHPEAEFVQLQLNYADWLSPSVESKKCYETARAHGKPVIIMEPVKGGLLATPPDAVGSILTEANPNVSLPSWAIRFAASLEGVLTVLSGMSDISQMEDNLKTMKNFTPLTEEETDTVQKAADTLASLPVVPCTSCKYCTEVCPNDIAIPGIFEAMNLYTLYGNLPFAKNKFFWNTKANGHKVASECVKCGKCEEACPQHIKIPDEIEKSIEIFE